jgi:hypothetical protein
MRIFTPFKYLFEIKKEKFIAMKKKIIKIEKRNVLWLLHVLL